MLLEYVNEEMVDMVHDCDRLNVQLIIHKIRISFSTSYIFLLWKKVFFVYFLC